MTRHGYTERTRIAVDGAFLCLDLFFAFLCLDHHHPDDHAACMAAAAEHHDAALEWLDWPDTDLSWPRL